MKTTFLLFFFMLITTFGFSQNDNQDPRFYQNIEPSTFSWGDRYYEKNIEGIGFLMNDLQSIDPNLYQNLQPRYDVLLQRNKNAKAILWGGAGVGTVLMVASFAPLLKDLINSSPPTTASLRSNKDNPSIGWGLLGGGLILTSIAGIAGAKKLVKHQDILNFTNQFNHFSEGDKIEFTMRPVLDFGRNFSAGVSVSILF
jgi:hypothetical protein